MKLSKTGDIYTLDLNFKSHSHKQSILLTSDLHVDSPKTDLNWLKKLFREAVANGSGIFVFGDFYDVMGMKYDKRSLKSDIRKDLQEDDYIMRVAKMGADFLAPFADNIMLITPGNHEQSVERRIEANLFELTNLFLFKDHGKQINFSQDYEGFIKIMASAQNVRKSKVMYYHHGTGGNATMSFGVLNVKRQAAVIDADIFVSGHLHNAWAKPLNRIGISNANKIENRETLHLQLGTAKDNGSWEREKRFDPAQKTFFYVDFSFYRVEKNKERTAIFDCIERRVK